MVLHHHISIAKKMECQWEKVKVKKRWWHKQRWAWKKICRLVSSDVKEQVPPTTKYVRLWLRIEKKLKNFRLFTNSDYEFRTFFKLNRSDNWIEVGESKILKKWAGDDFMGGVAITSNDIQSLLLSTSPKSSLFLLEMWTKHSRPQLSISNHALRLLV